MRVRISSVAPTGVSLVLEVAKDTTIRDLKRQLSTPPHDLGITSETRVLARLQKGVLVRLEDSAKVRGALILHGLGAAPPSEPAASDAVPPAGRPGRASPPPYDSLEQELLALRNMPADERAAGDAEPAPARTEWCSPMQRSFRVIIVRHGERVDLVFGPSWIQHCFPAGGDEYVRCDLNMPKSLPSRPLEYWAVDPPMTELGHWQARQIGEALADGPPIGAVFTSPALRCRQTAEEIQRQLPGLPRVRVEPGLYEMGSWGGPRFGEAFLPAGAEAATALPPRDEGVEDWYRRSDGVLRRLMERHGRAGVGDLLLVAHALSHEVLAYGALSLQGPLPPAVSRAQSREAKIYVMKSRGSNGSAPINTNCGVAILWYSNVKNALTPVDDALVSITHHQNSAFAFRFRFADAPGADAGSRAARAPGPRASAVGAAAWLVLPPEEAEVGSEVYEGDTLRDGLREQAEHTLLMKDAALVKTAERQR